MGFSELFTDIITKLETIPDPNPVPQPKTSNNLQQTKSNRNQLFKTINIWNDQIDNEIKEKGYIIKCPAIFIEFLPEEPKLILGGVTQYMDAKIYFHIFSDQLNTPNNSILNRSDSGDFMDANIEIYNLRDTVKTTFLGFHTHNSSAMMSRYDALDYRHNQLTKYLLGFTFCFNDEKGSIFDQKSSRYLVQGTLTNGTLDIIPKPNDWISGESYAALVSIVHFSGVLGGANEGLYLCTTSNSSVVFTPSEWALLSLWTSGTVYTVGVYVLQSYFVYQCSTSNSDVTFNPSNWTLITRM